MEGTKRIDLSKPRKKFSNHSGQALSHQGGNKQDSETSSKRIKNSVVRSGEPGGGTTRGERNPGGVRKNGLKLSPLRRGWGGPKRKRKKRAVRGETNVFPAGSDGGRESLNVKKRV